MIGLHAGILFFSYAAFFLAVVSGLAFLIQEYRLKRKDPRFLNSMTLPLELLDRVNLYAVVAGFGLFTFGMVGGHLLARKEWGSFFSADPKVMSSLFTWAVYAMVLTLRLTVGLRGRRVVFMSVLSFGMVLFTFAGVNYWLGGRHVFF